MANAVSAIEVRITYIHHYHHLEKGIIESVRKNIKNHTRINEDSSRPIGRQYEKKLIGRPLTEDIFEIFHRASGPGQHFAFYSELVNLIVVI